MHKKHPLSESIREIIFGIEDGAVGCLGVVVGLAHAMAAPHLILLGGFATMFAQAISMSAGTYLSVKSEKEYFGSKKKSFGKEYTEHKNPFKSAGIMALAVIIGTAIPITPFLVMNAPMMGAYTAIGLTLAALFLVGAAKTKWTKKNWFRSGFEMFLVGALAASAGWLVGSIFAA